MMQQTLPDELYELIMSFCDLRDVVRSTLVCQQFHDLIFQSIEIWHYQLLNNRYKSYLMLPRSIYSSCPHSSSSLVHCRSASDYMNEVKKEYRDYLKKSSVVGRRLEKTYDTCSFQFVKNQKMTSVFSSPMAPLTSGNVYVLDFVVQSEVLSDTCIGIEPSCLSSDDVVCVGDNGVALDLLDNVIVHHLSSGQVLEDKKWHLNDIVTMKVDMTDASKNGTLVQFYRNYKSIGQTVKKVIGDSFHVVVSVRDHTFTFNVKPCSEITPDRILDASTTTVSQTGGTDTTDVKLVSEHANVSHSKARSALLKANGDIVTAILDLT